MHLILAEGSVLDSGGRVGLCKGNQLTIWTPEPDGTGKLMAKNGIGGWGNIEEHGEAGTLTINGGFIEATSRLGTGIGGGASGNTQEKVCGGDQVPENEGTLTTRTIQPKGGLPVGIYRDEVTVTYGNGKTVKKEVVFTVGEVRQGPDHAYPGRVIWTEGFEGGRLPGRPNTKAKTVTAGV